MGGRREREEGKVVRVRMWTRQERQGGWSLEPWVPTTRLDLTGRTGEERYIQEVPSGAPAYQWKRAPPSDRPQGRLHARPGQRRTLQRYCWDYRTSCYIQLLTLSSHLTYRIPSHPYLSLSLCISKPPSACRNGWPHLRSRGAGWRRQVELDAPPCAGGRRQWQGGARGWRRGGSFAEGGVETGVWKRVWHV